MNSTNTDHIVHTENPTCSMKIEKIRFRIAIRRPIRAQNVGFSGSQ